MKCPDCSGELDAYFTSEGISFEEACSQCQPDLFRPRTACPDCGVHVLDQYFDPDYHLVTCQRCNDKIPESSISSDGQNCISCADILSKAQCGGCGSLTDDTLQYTPDGDLCNQCYDAYQSHLESNYQYHV